MSPLDVLVIGAGPAGLVTAIELARRGVRCEIVDRLAHPQPGTRCPTLWPRTLDLFQAMGASVAELRKAGNPLRRKVFRIGGETAAIDLTEGGHQVPLLVGQEQTEKVLTQRLHELGVAIERSLTAKVVAAAQEQVLVELAGRDVVRQVSAQWVVLASGRDTIDRQASVTGYPGLVCIRADVAMAAGRLENDAEYIFRDETGHAGLVPLPDGRHRLFLTRSILDSDELPSLVRRITGLKVDHIDPPSVWIQQPQSWLTSAHRTGRILRVGESAARFPMPVHGFNNAVSDACNLGWKLAMVIQGQASPSLLDTFAQERREAAAALLDRTGRILGHGSTTSLELLRDRLRRGVFDLRGEPVTSYGPGLLTVDRLPASQGGPAPGSLGSTCLTTPGWTVLIPPAATDLRDAVVRAITALPSVICADPTGDESGAAVVLLRPDGHVGYRGAVSDLAGLRDYVRAVTGA